MCMEEVKVGEEAGKRQKKININKFNTSTEYSKGNKTVPGKVAITRTEDGHKQNTKTSVTI